LKKIQTQKWHMPSHNAARKIIQRAVIPPIPPEKFE
jgi:hypothetical protein